MREVSAGDVLGVGEAGVAATPAVHQVRRGLGGADLPSLGYGGGSRAGLLRGDTAVFPEMEALGPLDVALLPVWGWGTTIGPGHLDPCGAAETLPS